MVLQKIKEMYLLFVGGRPARRTLVILRAFKNLVTALAEDKFADASHIFGWDATEITDDPVVALVEDGVAYLRVIGVNDAVIKQYITDAFSGSPLEDDDLETLWEAVNALCI